MNAQHITLARFMDALAEHDAETGDEGGDVDLVAKRLGMSAADGKRLLARAQREIGAQAR